MSKENQEAMAILTASKSTSVPENSKLVAAVTLGGLWAANHYIERMLMISEKYFCLKTDVYTRKIPVFDLMKAIIEFQPVMECYKTVLGFCEIEISKEVAKIVLYNIISLYIKVRSFSLVKDVVQRHKINKNLKGKATSLPKSLKKPDDKIE